MKLQIAGSTEALPAAMHEKGKFVALVICWFLGLGTLLTWNVVSTIGDYFYDLFPDYHPARVLTLVYLSTALTTITILLHLESKIDTRKRNIAGFILFFASNLALLLLVLATPAKGGIGKYIGICIVVFLFGVADSHVQGGLVGELSLMCPDFIQSFLAGLAASGVLTSGLRLLTKGVFVNVGNGLWKGTLVFLAISTFIELLCIFLYAFIFPNLPIVKYYRAKAASEGSNVVSSDKVEIQTVPNENVEREVDFVATRRLSNKELLSQNIDIVLDLFLKFVVTYSIFPGFLYENTGSYQLTSWYPLVLIAAYNASNFIGRYVPLVQCLRMESRKGLMTAVISRFLLIPAFYFGSKYAGEGWMIALVSLLGFSAGYLIVCIMTTAPKGYKGPEKNAIGNLLVLTIEVGSFVGAILDCLWLIGNRSSF